MSRETDTKAAGAASRLRVWHIRLYRICDNASGAVVLFVLIAGPWAFGTTQPNVITIMTVLGCLLAIMLGIKLIVRRFLGFQSDTWFPARPAGVLRWINCGLAATTLLLLAWCLVSALNARSTWNWDTASFVYFDCVDWLPHSLDRSATWRMFWTCAGLAGFFWAVVDWLPGLTLREQLARRRISRGEPLLSSSVLPPMPGRLRSLLWVLCANGGLLGMVSIVQLLSGTGELLWLLEPRVNKGPDTFFGPYAYRANAAQYFNMVWPVCLGFWWVLQRHFGFRRWRHQWLLVFATVMAACPVISTTRGGALVMFVLLVLSGLILVLSPALLLTRPRLSPMASLVTLGLVCAFLMGSVWLAMDLGWKTLEPRMTEIEAGYVQREAMYETASRIVEDYPLFGVGPGAFESVFQLYRSSPEEYWPAQLHNDWLELRITFGSLGFALICASLFLVLTRWWLPGGIHGGRRFVVFLWLAVGGCLLHARFDFPFRIHSVIVLFLLLCAVLFVISRRGSTPTS